mgnify:CR=1 FL=1|jgi:hypothetical protein
MYRIKLQAQDRERIIKLSYVWCAKIERYRIIYFREIIDVVCKKLLFDYREEMCKKNSSRIYS